MTTESINELGRLRKTSDNTSEQVLSWAKWSGIADSPKDTVKQIFKKTKFDMI